MKAKTLMGMIACAGACVSLSAFGNTTNNWFGVTATTEIVPVDCTTNGVAVSVESNKIVLDNDVDSPLTITPTTPSPELSDNVVKITGTALLTPSSTNDFEVTADAKAGFAVGIDDHDATNYYGYADGEWYKLTGNASNAATQETTFSLVIDYRVPNVRFYLGDTLLTSEDGQTPAFELASGATAFTAIDAFGTGSITSIAGGYEVAVCAIENGAKYGSVADAKAANGTESTILSVGTNGTTGGATAANGLSSAVCIALGLDTTDSTANIAVAPVETDSDSEHITLRLTSPLTGPEANLVGYKVSGGTSEDSVCEDPESITIPLSAGTYTITPVLK